jgi:hypothetical protein
MNHIGGEATMSMDKKKTHQTKDSEFGPVWVVSSDQQRGITLEHHNS